MRKGKSRAQGQIPVHLVLMAKLIILTGVGAAWGEEVPHGCHCAKTWVEHHRKRQDGVYRRSASVPGADGPNSS